MKRMLLVIQWLVLAGCMSNQYQLREVKNDGITLQVIQLKKDPDGPATYSCKARLLPDKLFFDQKKEDVNNEMIYKMDSCFYLQSGAKKVYASLVQPIANGVSGSYEYLIEFETSANSGFDFVYQDRYLNQKKYSLKL